MLLAVTQTATLQVLLHANSHDLRDSHGEGYHLSDHAVSVPSLAF